MGYIPRVEDPRWRHHFQKKNTAKGATTFLGNDPTLGQGLAPTPRKACKQFSRPDESSNFSSWALDRLGSMKVYKGLCMWGATTITKGRYFTLPQDQGQAHFSNSTIFRGFGGLRLTGGHGKGAAKFGASGVTPHSIIALLRARRGGAVAASLPGAMAGAANATLEGASGRLPHLYDHIYL